MQLKDTTPEALMIQEDSDLMLFERDKQMYLGECEYANASSESDDVDNDRDDEDEYDSFLDQQSDDQEYMDQIYNHNRNLPQSEKVNKLD